MSGKHTQGLAEVFRAIAIAWPEKGPENLEKSGCAWKSCMGSSGVWVALEAFFLAFDIDK